MFHLSLSLLLLPYHILKPESFIKDKASLYKFEPECFDGETRDGGVAAVWIAFMDILWLAALELGWKQSSSKDIISPQTIQSSSGCQNTIQQLVFILFTVRSNISTELCLRRQYIYNELTYVNCSRSIGFHCSFKFSTRLCLLMKASHGSAIIYLFWVISCAEVVSDQVHLFNYCT